MKGRTLRIILIVLALLVAVFAIYQIIAHFEEEKEAETIYSNFLEYIEEPTETEDNATLWETTGVSTEGTQDEESELTDPEPQDESLPIIDFASLQVKYPDVVGWIYSPDTPINYPIVCGKDNNQYLRHLPDGSYNTAGSIFLDYRCEEIGETQNTVIYGHNMKNGTMFSSLTKYKSQDYYDSHPTVYLSTPEGNYQIELYAGAVVKVSSDIYLSSPGEALLQKALADVKSKSTFASDVTIEPGENIVTLSTCSYEFENARYVIVGKLILI